MPANIEIVPIEKKHILRSSNNLLLQVSQESRACALGLYELSAHPIFEHPVYLSPASDFALMHDYTTLFDFCYPEEGQSSIRSSLNFLAVQPYIDLAHQIYGNGHEFDVRFPRGLDVVSSLLCSAVKQIGTLRELVIFVGHSRANEEIKRAQLTEKLKSMMEKDLLALDTESWKSEKELEALCWKIPKISMVQAHIESRSMNLRIDLEAFLGKGKEIS
jgi:hypothetical protein